MTPNAKAMAKSIDFAIGTFMGTLSSAGDKMAGQIAVALTAEQKPEPRSPEPEPCPKCDWHVTVREILDEVEPPPSPEPEPCLACRANGMMNGGWPVAIGGKIWFVLAEKAESGKILGMRRSYVGHSVVEIQTASGIWWRALDQLWHTRAEAEAALAKGGEDGS